MYQTIEKIRRIEGNSWKSIIRGALSVAIIISKFRDVGSVNHEIFLDV